VLRGRAQKNPGRYLVFGARISLRPEGLRRYCDGASVRFVWRFVRWPGGSHRRWATGGPLYSGLALASRPAFR